MIVFEPLRPEHLKYAVPVDVQADEWGTLMTPEGQELLRQSFGLSAWHEGRCLGASGLFHLWPGRAEAWALLTIHAKPFMRPIIKLMRRVLNEHDTRRIEMHVLYDNPAGHHIARLLGFTVETPRAVAYDRHGRDITVYTRIR